MVCKVNHLHIPKSKERVDMFSQALYRYVKYEYLNNTRNYPFCIKINSLGMFETLTIDYQNNSNSKQSPRSLANFAKK